MNFKLVGLASLKGCRVGFNLKGSRDIFVCPSVAKLASTDLGLLRGLRIFRMGKRKQQEGVDLDTWVLQVSAEHEIFGEKNESGDE